MRIIKEAGAFDARGSVVSIGMFDGVHRGHRRVLQALREKSRELTLPSVVLTFDPHPRAVLSPRSAPRMLVSLERRLELLTMTGAADHCLVLPFNHGASQTSAQDFVRHTLVGQLHMRALVVGENFSCGRGRAGDIAVLKSLGARFGFTVHPVALRTQAESPLQPHCSSTEMRRLIESGDIVRAAIGLDRPHEMVGTISSAARRHGRVVEVLLPHGMCTPADDDYMGAVRTEKQASPWVSALLQVRRDSLADHRTVRLVADDVVPADSGERVALRFLAPARASISSFKQGISA